MHYVGVDYHKRSSYVTVMDQHQAGASVLRTM